MEKDNRAIRYRVYPTDKQQDILQQTIESTKLLNHNSLFPNR